MKCAVIWINAFGAWVGTRNCQIVPRNLYRRQTNDIPEPPGVLALNILVANIKATKVAAEHAIINRKRQLAISYLPISDLCDSDHYDFNHFWVPIGLYARGVCMRTG